MRRVVKSPRLSPIVLASLISLSAAAQAPFVLSASLTGMSNVRGVTAADVNGDGKPDLICVGTPNLLFVWTNSGTGQFVSNRSYTLGTLPRQVIAVDVNGDGSLDLITANVSGNSLSVLTNDGTGGFTLAATLRLGASSQPRSVAAADLFGRGKPDLISANSLLASFTVWTNIGAGNFVSNFSLSVGSPGFTVPEWAAAADLNGDGKMDIIGACNNSDTRYLHLWTNNGAGGFAPAPVPFLDPFLNGFDVAVPTDINGDGKPDLVLATEWISDSNRVTVLTNNGSGELVLAGYSLLTAVPNGLAVADVDGDGQLDVIAAIGPSVTSLIVLTNGGAGVFGFNTNITIASNPETVAAADVNGDGRYDLISGNLNTFSGMSVFTNAAAFTPRLALKRSGTDVIVSWPAIWASWNLQQTTNLAAGNWTSFSGPIGNDSINKIATNPASADIRFFRLSNP